MIPIEQHFSRNLDELVERRAQFLTGYQDAAYAERYRALVVKVRKIETGESGSTKLAEAVARYYAKLLAYKDEYEVARLYTDGAFSRRSKACSRATTSWCSTSPRRCWPSPTRAPASPRR